MKFIITLVLSFSLFLTSSSFAQNQDINGYNSLKIQDLKSKIMNIKNVSENFSLKIAPPITSKKSPALALALSFILPGAGHFYLNRMDVGKYFLGIDAASWIGLASLNIYGDAVRKDARTFSAQHANISDLNNKEDDYFSDIGTFNNIYEYNNEKLIRGEYSLLYNVDNFFWNWDNPDNRNLYEAQRKSSERIYNTRIVFGSLLIVNRIISGISALLLANKENKKTSSLNIEPELIYKNDYSFEGIKINLSKNF